MSKGGLTRLPSPWGAFKAGATLGQVFLAAVVAVPAPSASAEEFLRRLQQRYETVDTFSAEFTQIFSSQGIEQRESGRLIMKKPGKMYWEYQQPARKVFVSDGAAAYFYVPAERQVMVTELSPEDTDTPLLFLFGKGDLSRDFEVSFEAEEESREVGYRLLRLEPRQPRGDFSRVLLEVDPSTLRISRLSVIEPIGSRNDYLLSGVEENIRVPDRTFRFKIPPGVEVIRQ